MEATAKATERQAGALMVVGTGIQAVGQITLEAQSCAKSAEKLFYLASDPLTERYLCELNPTAESLQNCYADNRDRFESYLEMIDRIMTEVRRGLDVCVAFYGHPGVFVYPSHEVVRQARREGYRARMMPGISAEDCLFADLGVDPAIPGCHSFEATDFLLFRRRFDPHCSLILWQVGLIGDLTFRAEGYDNRNIGVLADYLVPVYGRDHPVTIYEASHFSVYDARMEKTTIGGLAEVRLTAVSTLYVPPLKSAPMDEGMLQRLGIDSAQLRKVELSI